MAHTLLDALFTLPYLCLLLSCVMGDRWQGLWPQACWQLQTGAGDQEWWVALLVLCAYPVQPHTSAMQPHASIMQPHAAPHASAVPLTALQSPLLLGYLSDVSRGMTYLHSQGIIHGGECR